VLPEGEAGLSSSEEVCCLWGKSGATERRLDQQGASQKVLGGAGLAIEVSVCSRISISISISISILFQYYFQTKTKSQKSQ
jgi:hypothetical protein